jgi:GNAT superfamily N-acetyltransferase
MDGIETLRRAKLTPGDIPAAHALSAAVGWNQTLEDWGLFLRHGDVLAMFDGETLVATAAVMPYADAFAWISMVLVAPTWRRQGIAGTLLQQCVDLLRARRRRAFLDATPAGAEVYSRLGFRTLCGVERWEREGGAVEDDATQTKAFASEDADALIAADRQAFGADRGFLLRDFLARPGAIALISGDGYVVMRPGHRATQLGPLIAGSLQSATGLLKGALARTRDPVLLDLLEPWTSIVPVLQSYGFRPQRPFRRMALDGNALPGEPRRLVVAAGPEFG